MMPVNEETARKGDAVKFLVVLAQEDHFNRWDAAGEAEREEFFRGHAEFLAAVRALGEVLAVEPLQRPEHAVTLRSGIASDGPFVETTELVNGIYIIEMPSLQDAVEAARHIRMPTVEIRPLLEV